MKKYYEIIRELRENRDYTQKQIAERLGYSSLYAFSRAFKEKFGVSPKQYERTEKDKKGN